MRTLRGRNINDLVRYLRQHRQGQFRGGAPCDCPVAAMYAEKLHAEVSVGTSDMCIKRRTYRTYALIEDFRRFIKRFDKLVGCRWVEGSVALEIAEQLRDRLREEYLESLHAS